MAIKAQVNVQIDSAKIEADLKNFADIFCKEVARQASQIISKFAFQEMMGYYGEYDPRMYQRTYDMMLFSHLPIIQKTINGYQGGIHISAGNTDHIRGLSYSEADLYNDVWVKGIHGVEHIQYNTTSGVVDMGLQPIQGEPDRLGKLKKKAYSDTTKQLLINKGLSAARSAKNGYSILKF